MRLKVVARVVLFAILASLSVTCAARASSPEAWADFHRDVKTKCLNKATSLVVDPRLMVWSLGSVSYGYAKIHEQSKTTKIPTSLICLYNKRQKTAEVGKLTVEASKVSIGDEMIEACGNAWKAAATTSNEQDFGTFMSRCIYTFKTIPPKRDFAGIKLWMSLNDLQAHITKEKCHFHLDISDDEIKNISCPVGSYTIWLATNLDKKPIKSIIFRYCSGQTAQEAHKEIVRLFNARGVYDVPNGYKLDQNVTLAIDNIIDAPGCIISGVQVNRHTGILKNHLMYRLDQQAKDDAARKIPPPKF